MWGGPQEACADHRVCLCCPGPDTPENASCSWVDTGPALSLLTPGGTTGGGSVHYVRLPSGSGQMLMPWIKGCHLSRLVCGPYPVSSFLFCINIFWNPFLRCVYLSLSHRCFVSLHFWGICKASDKSELTPISQWDSLHASLIWNVCLFIYFGYKPLFDMTIANIFSISYIISHFIHVSPWQGFQVWCTHSCSLFLSLPFL